jgi:hypothetical protein
MQCGWSDGRILWVWAQVQADSVWIFLIVRSSYVAKLKIYEFQEHRFILFQNSLSAVGLIYCLTDILPLESVQLEMPQKIKNIYLL